MFSSSSSAPKLHAPHLHLHLHLHRHRHRHLFFPHPQQQLLPKSLLAKISASSSSLPIPVFNQPHEESETHLPSGLYDGDPDNHPHHLHQQQLLHSQEKKKKAKKQSIADNGGGGGGGFSFPFPISVLKPQSNPRLLALEEGIEQAIFNCRFLTLLGVAGSLAGSVLCFFKGCAFVVQSFVEYYQTCWYGMHTGKVILLLVEAVDVYLMGTVMLIFGMGLYELFVNSLEVPEGGKCVPNNSRTTICGSNLFGLFRLRERPKWLEIHSLDELKTKIGHVIVMILLVGMFEKSKKVPIHSGADLLCFSASILLSSGSLFLLSKLHAAK